MCEELPYQIINIWAVNRVVFCYHKKFARIIIEKKNIVAGGSEQRRDALFWIHLRQTWLELFRLL